MSYLVTSIVALVVGLLAGGYLSRRFSQVVIDSVQGELAEVKQRAAKLGIKL